MTLTLRKFLVLALIATVFLVANALAIAYWLNDSGAIDFAAFLRKEFLTGTAITVILALLFLLVGPTPGNTHATGRHHACGVCGASRSAGAYCNHCGSKS
jgi:hypothetical protein